MTDTDRTREQLVQELEQMRARVAQLEQTVAALSDHTPGIAELELDGIFRALPDLYFRTDVDGTILDYRAGHVTDLYLPPERFLGKRMQAVLPPEVSQSFLFAYQELAQDKPQAIAHYTLKKKYGPTISAMRASTADIHRTSSWAQQCKLMAGYTCGSKTTARVSRRKNRPDCSLHSLQGFAMVFALATMSGVLCIVAGLLIREPPRRTSAGPPPIRPNRPTTRDVAGDGVGRPRICADSRRAI